MTSEGLTLETVEADDSSVPTTRVVARGDIDLATAPDLAGRFEEIIGTGVQVIVLDAAGVGFLDSSGIRVLVQASQELEASGGRIVIENMSPPVARVLEITGLTERYAPS